MTPTFIEDFARGLAMLGEREEALGEVWHVPTAELTTGRQCVRTIFEECGEDAKVGMVGSRLAKALGLFWPLARERTRTIPPNPTLVSVRQYPLAATLPVQGTTAMKGAG
jgi:hypothetical protein